MNGHKTLDGQEYLGPVKNGERPGTLGSLKRSQNHVHASKTKDLLYVTLISTLFAIIKIEPFDNRKK
jgi:hypothetical protein